MEPPIFVKGLIIGFSIAAPVGPIGVLCIRRTLTDGRLAGFLSGLGAATADAIYGCVAGFGLTVISGVLLSHVDWLRVIGGLFLCYLGVKTWLSRPAEQAASVATPKNLIGAYASTVFLTLTNPSTILSFLAVFAGLGLASAESSRAAIALVGGVFLGSATWWLLLSSGTGALRDRIQPKHLRWINRLSGFILFGFGLIALKL